MTFLSPLFVLSHLSSRRLYMFQLDSDGNARGRSATSAYVVGPIANHRRRSP
jgi:hypothetical protein